MPKDTIRFFNKTDRDLARLTKAFGVNSEADVVRNLLCSKLEL